jgi:hypothetical protein
VALVDCSDHRCSHWTKLSADHRANDRAAHVSGAHFGEGDFDCG